MEPKPPRIYRIVTTSETPFQPGNLLRVVDVQYQGTWTVAEVPVSGTPRDLIVHRLEQATACE